MISGQKEIFNSENLVALSDNEFTLITTPICLMTEKKSFPKVNYKSVLLFFDNQVLEELKLKHLDLLQNPKTTAFNEIEVFKYDDYCTNFRSSLILLLSGKGVSKQELLRVKFNEIMLYLIQREPLKMGPC